MCRKSVFGKVCTTMALCFFLVIDVSLHGQERIDSLSALLPGNTDSERAQIFYELAYEYVDLKPSVSVMYGTRSFEYAKQIRDSLGMVKAGRIKALAFRRLEELDSAIALALRVLPIARRNHYNRETNQILRGLALAYTYEAKYDSGLYYNFELLRATEQDKENVERSFAFTNIGVVYYKLTNFEKALQYYTRALETADVKLPVNQYHITNTLLNISLCYSHLKNFSSAKNSFKKALDSLQSPEPGVMDIQALQVVGLFYLKKGNLDSAEFYYSKGYSLTKDLGKKRFQLIFLSDLVDIYLTRNQISLAVQYLSEAESAIEGTPFKTELLDLYARFRSYNKRTRNNKQLTFYQEKYIKLKSSISDESLTTNLMKIESEYIERSNNGKIAEQEQLLVLQDQVINRKNAFNILVIIMTALLSLLLYFLYRSNAEKKLANRLLEQRVKERTDALEHSHRSLQQAFASKNASIAKTFGIVKQHVATLRGLCSVALTDDGRLQGENRFQQLAVVTSDVVLTLNKISDIKTGYDL